MSVLPSIRTEQLGFHWTNFHIILLLSIFRKYVEKIQVLLKGIRMLPERWKKCVDSGGEYVED
jgi:hypothetical protein